MDVHYRKLITEIGIQNALETISALVREERDAHAASKDAHPAVLGLLDSVIEATSVAAMEYEMSFK